MSKITVTLAVFLVAALGACAARQPQATQPTQPVYFEADRAATTVSSDPYDHPEASLWDESTAHSFLFLDHKARRVNDIVIVNILESSSATNSAATKGSKTSSISAGAKTLFGVENELANTVTSGFNPASVLAAESENKFDGSGETTRKGTLVATVAARVRDVLPNGNLYVVGQREIVVNNEKQTIALTGIVRPRDINFNNEVNSTAIADFQVQYGGRGMVAQNQYQGWLARFFGWIWPF